MKILIVHNYYRYRGGEETYVKLLTDLLRSKKHDIYLYTKDSRDIEKNDISLLSVSERLVWNKTNYDEISEIIKEFKPNIAHCNNVFPLITPIIYKSLREHKIPIVQTIHNYRFLCPKGTLFRDNHICDLCVRKKFKYPSIIHKCYVNSALASSVISSSLLLNDDIIKKIDHFLFPSLFTQEYYQKYYIDLNNNSSYIPYFVPPSNKRNNESKYFLYIGRFSEEKGIEELLQIMSTLPHIPFVAIGTGPLKEKLVAIYSKYKNITFIDHISPDKVRTYLQKTTCLIIPSKWYEVLPFVYLEAMSMGVPVLTPDTKVFSRNIEKNTLYYYRFNDFTDLKLQISLIYKQKNASHLFYEEYRSQYTPEHHYKSLSSLYKQLIHK